MLTVRFWEELWKLWLIGSILAIFFLLNRRELLGWILAIVYWLKDGVEDSDGQLHSKDLWLMVFSITLIVMGFLEWLTQKPFPKEFWGIISVLTTGRLLIKGVEDYFIKRKEDKKNADEEEEENKQ